MRAITCETLGLGRMTPVDNALLHLDEGIERHREVSAAHAEFAASLEDMGEFIASALRAHDTGNPVAMRRALIGVKDEVQFSRNRHRETISHHRALRRALASARRCIERAQELQQ
jgi:hypothetical protein